MMRRTATGRFELPIPASEAIEYFTPEGERRWVPGWNPTYPTGEASESPGTVFTTSHGEIETVWVIERIDRTRNTSAYARITPAHHAGTVRVGCEDQPNRQCIVTVDYDMTALIPSHPEILDAYDDDSFKAMMNEWLTGVTSAL
jgi:hypothetical protein